MYQFLRNLPLWLLIASITYMQASHAQDAVTLENHAEPERYTIQNSTRSAKEALLTVTPEQWQASSLVDLGSPIQQRAQTNPQPGIPQQIGFDRPVPDLNQPEKLRSTLTPVPSNDKEQTSILRIRSAQAQGLRLGLLIEQIHPQATLRFFKAGTNEQIGSTITGQQVLDLLALNVESGDNSEAAHTYWSPVIEGEMAMLAITHPAGVDEKTTRISIARVSHLYDFSNTTFTPKASASCNLDAVCESTWTNHLAMVARMVFQRDNETHTCTGTLMNDKDGATYIPYFLSANHCISTQTVASTLETRWFEQSATCNGAPLDNRFSITSGGAQLLYASPNTDTSFMRLLGNLPNGVIFSGWTANIPTLNDNVTGIHHPAGDLTKISFGSLTAFNACQSNADHTFSCSSANSTTGKFVNVRYTSGTTEEGSSGSGLFLNNGQYLIGTLWGGNSSCSNPSGINIYGRFDLAFNTALNNWLNPSSILTINKSGTGSGTVSSSPSGISCGSSCSASFANGTNIALTATPASNSSFTHWSGACSGAGICNITLDQTKSVTANFDNPAITGAINAALNLLLDDDVTIKSTLTVNLNGTGVGKVTSTPAGIDCGVSCSAQFDDKAAVQLTAAPQSGSVFVGWSGACTGTQTTCTVTIDSAKTVTAQFNTATVVKRALTVSLNGTGVGKITSVPIGIDCGLFCAAPFDDKTSVQLTVMPESGSIFIGWTGTCSGTQTTCSVLMDSAKNVTAQFDNSSATTAARNSIIGLYITYFNRAPDQSGLAYWVTQANATGYTKALFNISSSFAQASVASANYPASMTDTQFITKVYNYFLDRTTPDPSGLTYWQGRLATGVSRSNLMVEIVSAMLDYNANLDTISTAAQKQAALDSQTMVNNKLKAGIFFATDPLGPGGKTNIPLDANGNPDVNSVQYIASIDVLSGVTKDPATLEASYVKSKNYKLTLP